MSPWGHGPPSHPALPSVPQRGKMSPCPFRGPAQRSRAGVSSTEGTGRARLSVAGWPFQSFNYKLRKVKSYV